MPSLDIRLKVVSPMFLNGADSKGSPELRAASVRGQLRYWFRAIRGMNTGDLQKVAETEQQIFGSTTLGSTVSVRCFPMTGAETEWYAMLPHRNDPRERKRSEQEAIKPGQRCELQLVTRPGVEMPTRALITYRVWSYLGGLGKRSRRMFGAFEARIRPEPRKVEPYFGSIDEFADSVHQLLTGLHRNPQKLMDVYSDLPKFPTLNPAHSQIVIGRRGYDSWEALNVELFTDLLRTGKYRNREEIFGYARGGRRASPLIAQMRHIDNRYYPVLTVMRSEMMLPNKRPMPPEDWQLYNSFMEDAARIFDGVQVWGERF